MKKQTKEEKLFIRLADPAIVEEVWEENMLGNDMPFSEFFAKYQVKHIDKYHKLLQITPRK
jgi:hypothetical protein